MNLLYISPCQGAFGGIEAFVLAVADEMHSNGERIQVVFKRVQGFQPKDSLSKAAKNRAYPIHFIERGDMISISKGVQWADVVHVHNPLLEVMWLCHWFKKPCALTVYNWCRRNFHLRPIMWFLTNLLANHRWYISDFVWSTWEKSRASNSGKLPVVSNLPTQNTPYRKRKGFIFASRWIPNKGLRTLLLAYAQSSIEKSEWPLTLLGDGPLKQEVYALIKNEQIEGVEIAGFLSNNERNLKISQSKWMITIPNTNEDLGLTPIEARNVKVPCIVTRDGGLSEAAGKWSLSCEPGDIDQVCKLIETVASFSEEDYISIAESSWSEIQSYLKPLDEYRVAYQNIRRSFNK